MNILFTHYNANILNYIILQFWKLRSYYLSSIFYTHIYFFDWRILGVLNPINEKLELWVIW